jgi:hypothetical protein
LAHWIYQNSNIKFCYFSDIRRKKVCGLYIDVSSYNIKDIVSWMNILMIKYELSCSLHTLKQKKPYIYVNNKSIPLLLKGIRPYISSWVKTNNVYQSRALSSLFLSTLESSNVNKPINGFRLYSTKPAFKFSVRSVHNGSPLANKVVPVLSYANAETFKREILNENKGK